VKYLLDTNPCIVYLRGRNPLLRNRVASHAPSDIVMCSVVLAELLHGTERSADPVKGRIEVSNFARPYGSLPFDDAAADEYALIRVDLERRGLPIGDNDMFIAAIARSNNLTLVTHNTAEFSRIPNLNIEDWEVP
jgi:tRNA(fMet)-specific endonuclease VapC